MGGGAVNYSPIAVVHDPLDNHKFGAQLVLEFHANPPKTCPNNSAAVRTKARAGALGGALPYSAVSRPWSRMRLMVA